MTNPIQITHLPLASITPSPMNPRKHFDNADIAELAQSIAAKGVLQPILVRPNGKKNHYEIVAGERRYRASKTLETVNTIPAIIREMSDEEAMEIQIIENLQRKDISPMEEAVGFKQLQTVRNMDLKEIGLRVGKPSSYVAQRLKLNALIEPMQQMVHRHNLTLRDAIHLAGFQTRSQQEFYNTVLKGRVEGNEVIEITSWTWSRFQNKLSNPPFDTTDTTLVPSMGACTTCQFNSSANALFPEHAKHPVCQNSDCFKKKCDLSYERELNKSIEDPGVVLLAGTYSDRETKELKKKYDGVIGYMDAIRYQTHPSPTPPDPQDFAQDPEDYDNEVEAHAESQKRYQKAVESYQKQLDDFNKRISRGSLKKAYTLSGDDKGKYVWISLQKASSNGTQKTAATKPNTAAEIKEEIERIQSRAKRSRELDDVKIWEKLQPLFDPAVAVKDPRGSNDNPLSEAEIIAFAHAIQNKLTYGHRDVFNKLFRKPGQLDLRRMIRFFFFSELTPRVIYSSISGDALLMKMVAEEYWPDQIAEIINAQKEVAQRREAKAKSRISELQKNLKQKKPIGANANKATSRKQNKIKESV